MFEKDFGEMVSDEQQDLMKKVGDALKRFDLGYINIKMKIMKECDLQKSIFKENGSLEVIYDMPLCQTSKIAMFERQVIPIIKGIKNVTVRVDAKIGPSDPYIAIEEAISIKDIQIQDIEHNDDKVWLIEFVSTWVKPCEQPIEYMQMLDRANWGSTVRLLRVSIDNKKTTVGANCRQIWKHVDHYHIHMSEYTRKYGAKGLGKPHIMLIDKQGIIAFMGNPSDRDNIQQDIDNLTRGKTIAGKGTIIPPGVPKDAKTFDSDFFFKELSDINRLLDKFCYDDELKEQTKDFIVANCGIAAELYYCPNTRCFWAEKYVSQRNLSGPKEELEWVEKILNGDFKGHFDVEVNKHIEEVDE